MAGHFWRVCLERPRVCQPVMLKCFESIVVAHCGLADKQCVGTRRHPATLTDKTDFWGDSGRGGEGCSRKSVIHGEGDEHFKHTLAQCDHLQADKIWVHEDN